MLSLTLVRYVGSTGLSSEGCRLFIVVWTLGTKQAPSYANLFMTEFEQNHVYTYPQRTLWKRFIDDIFMTWPHGMDSLLEFIQHLNNVHPTIKFTSTISPTEISFLDLIKYTRDDKLYTRLHTKNTDRQMYLNFHSNTV